MVPKVRKKASKEYRIILKATKSALKDWLVLKSSEMASCLISDSQIWTYAFYFLFKALYERPSNCFVQLVCALIGLQPFESARRLLATNFPLKAGSQQHCKAEDFS